MELEVVLKIIAIAIVHWVLVPVALTRLVGRQRVLGGRKVPWALAIVFITCFGSLFYLLLHPPLQTEAAHDRRLLKRGGRSYPTLRSGMSPSSIFPPSWIRKGLERWLRRFF